MTNEAAGSRPSSMDDSSPFDVAPTAPTKGTYLIETDEIDHEQAIEEADEQEEGAEPPLPKRRIPVIDLPPAGATREVPDFFPPSMIPKGIGFPKGIEAVFVKIPASFTAARHKGDRYLIIWGTSEADEKLAIGRSMGDSNRAGGEMAKQTIRAVDGHVADWSGMPTPGSVDSLWREVGPKGRNLLTRLLMKINTLMEAELTHFFEECIAVVPTG